MTSRIVFVSCCLWTFLSITWGDPCFISDEDCKVSFVDHLIKFDLQYKDIGHFESRLRIFCDNYQSILNHNCNSKASYRYGLNKFSHLTRTEFKDYIHLGGSRLPYDVEKINAVACSTAPVIGKTSTSINWVSAGAVTSVKDQGNCGSCYAFASAGAMEGAYKITRKQSLTNFSEQDIVSCSKQNGCNGGWVASVYSWVMSNKGIATETDYPYISGSTPSGDSETCNDQIPKSLPPPNGCVALFNTTSKILKALVTAQPVAIAVEGGQDAFYNYQSGILDDNTTCGDALDHAVLVVGYGTCDGGGKPSLTNCNCTNGENYWLIKNSWGTSWGFNGFACILRGASNVCGVLSAPSYPIY